MPRRRSSVASMQELRLVQLGSNAAQYCYELATKNVASFYDNINTIRIMEECSTMNRFCVPSFYLVNFCRNFFEGFQMTSETMSKEELVTYKRLALEMVIKLEIGRFLDGVDSRTLLSVFNPRVADKLLGWKILDLSDVPKDVVIKLDDFDLSEVTVFFHPTRCTLRDLQIIGKKCLNLEVLVVKESPKVIDPGLRALSECPMLRYVDISDCSKVTRKEMNHFLTTNKNVTEFYGWTQSRDEFTILSHPDEVVYENVKRFTLSSRFLTNPFAQTLVRKFPNLISLQLSVPRIEDLRILENLAELENLEFSKNSHFDLDNLKQLLSAIGGRITTLFMPLLTATNHLKQIDLDEILATCGNIENLSFAYLPVRAEETLLVKYLPKLKRSKCFLPLCYRRRTIRIELCETPELTRLSFIGFKNTEAEIERMMLDETNFPKLKFMDMHFENTEYLDHFKRFARENNLDLTINDYLAPRTTDYSFTSGAMNFDESS